MVTTKLSGAQIASLKKNLQDQALQLRAEIRAELLRSEHGQYADIAGRVHDSGEESVAQMLAEQNIALVEHQTQELLAVEAALQRIDAGHYGVCVDCEAPIAFTRLQAQPAAQRCITCQTQKEQTGSAA